MKKKVIIIDSDGRLYVCDSLDKVALLTGNNKSEIIYYIETGTADSRGLTYDYAAAENINKKEETV
mgnify:CR=1 FL=1